MKRLLLIILFCINALWSFGQINLGSTAYTQNFNTLATSGTSSTMPANWFFFETGANANTTYTAGTGSSNGGDTYSFGTSASSTNRALGSLLSGNLKPSFGASFKNTTGSTITKLKISFVGQTWRIGATNHSDRLDFSYSTDATSLNTGTWVDVDELDYQNDPSTTTFNGGSAIQTKNIEYTITGLNIANDAVFFIRFVDFDTTGADDGLAIDDFSIENASLSGNTPSLTANNLNLGNQNANTTSNATALNLNYANLDGTSVTLETAAPFTISTTIGGPYLNAITITGAELTGDNKDVFVKFNPTSIGLYDGNIKITGGGLNTTNVAVKGVSLDATQMSFNFEDCSSWPIDYPGGFIQYSVTGSQTWACTTFGRNANDATGKANSGNAIRINGGSSTSSTENEDWLIRNFDLSATNYPLLSFWSRTAFAGSSLQLKVSTNYSGSGNPNAATWTDIDGKFPLIQSDTWTKSSNIDLSSFKTANVYIAFVYTSPSATPSGGASWTVDDFEIINSSTPAPIELSLPVSSINFGYQAAGGTSAERSFTFSASSLTNDVILTAPANFSIAKTNVGPYSSSATYTLAEANNSSKTVFVKFSPTTNNTNYSQQLSIATTGVPTKTLDLSGNTFDTNNTLEVVNWNIEWFGATSNGPSNKTLQAANVKTIFGNINADIYGLAEVVDTTLFRNSALPAGYNVIFSDFGSYADNESHSGYSQAQKLAFMYRTDIIKPVRWFGVLRDTYYPGNLSNNGTGSPYKNWSSGRFPFLMEAKVLINGTEETVYFIDIHAKANTGSTDAEKIEAYDRRRDGAIQLKQYIDNNLAGKKVIILGDFNDVLNSDKTIAPQPVGTGTSYSAFTNDPTNYFPVTLPLSLAGKRSTAGFATVIDNVIINKNLNDNYLSNSAEVLDRVTALVNSYSTSTTDHYPIQTRYFFNTTLSVNWGYFTPSINGNTVTLKWETKSETDNSHFVVERSLDGKNFTKVAEQQSKGPQGAAYQAVDQTPAQGINYYRVQQVDRDGKSSYSEVKSVRFLGNNQATFFVYPNPVKNNITLNYSSNSNHLQLLVSGIDGRVQLRTTGSINDLNNQINQKVKDLARGVYIVQITDGGTTYQSKFVKE